MRTFQKDLELQEEQKKHITMLCLDYVGKEVRDTCWIFRFFLYSSFFLLSGQHCPYHWLFGWGGKEKMQKYSIYLSFFFWALPWLFFRTRRNRHTGWNEMLPYIDWSLPVNSLSLYPFFLLLMVSPIHSRTEASASHLRWFLRHKSILVYCAFGWL